MSRHQRILSPTSIYHIMLRGNEKKNIFLDDDDRYRFIDTLNVKKKENNFDVLAYCLMNNHVHLLVNGKDQAIARVMKCINVSYAMYFNRKYRRVGHLFQDRFKSEIINNDSYLISAIHYIHNNPVKAGMVGDAGDYPWSSFRDYTGMKSCLTDTSLILNMFSNNQSNAIESLIDSSNKHNGDVFLDMEDEAEINTEEEALAYIKQYLKKKGLTYEEMLGQKGRIKGTVKHELVRELKTRCSLGSREIGGLLGVAKSTVNTLQ